jgi:ankyrin repeat protein
MNWLYYKLNPFQTNEQALVWASRHGYVDIVDDLIIKGTDINTPHFPILSRSITVDDIINGNTDIPYIFLSNAPISCAVINGHIEVVKRLLQDPRIPSNAVNDAFQYAIIYNHMEICKLLLKFNYNINLITSSRIAIHMNRVEIIDYILGGTNIDISLLIDDLRINIIKHNESLLIAKWSSTRLPIFFMIDIPEELINIIIEYFM